MDPVNLAYPVEQTTSAKFRSLIDFIEHFAHDHPVQFAIVVGMVVIGVAPFFVWAHRFVKRAEPRGTAQVLSFVKIRGNKNGRDLCRIELEVHVPGREPYVKGVNYYLGPRGRRAVKPGRTVAVSVDSADLQNVRIDFS